LWKQCTVMGLIRIGLGNGLGNGYDMHWYCHWNGHGNGIRIMIANEIWMAVTKWIDWESLYQWDPRWLIGSCSDWLIVLYL
jgi:hypothetical protein